MDCASSFKPQMFVSTVNIFSQLTKAFIFILTVQSEFAELSVTLHIYFFIIQAQRVVLIDFFHCISFSYIEISQ